MHELYVSVGREAQAGDKYTGTIARRRIIR
jgi:hypothetical protein